MTTLDKTVLIVLALLSMSAFAYGYSEVVNGQIQNIVTALQATK